MRKAGFVIVVVVAVLAGYMLRRPPMSAPAAGEPTEAPAEVPVPVAPILLPRPMAAEPTLDDQIAAASTPTPLVLTTDQINILAGERAELRAIETYAAAERQKIETWYSGEVDRLKTWLEQRMQYLSDADKLAWAQFRQRVNETWSTTSGYDYASAYSTGYGSAYGWGYHSEDTVTRVRGNPAGDYAAYSAQIKDSKQATQEDFTRAQQELVWLRGWKLAGVQAEVDRRKSVVAWRQSRTQAEAARRLSGDETPKVSAVVGGNPPRALIGDALVSEGDTVQGYRVRSIRADRVEFERDGKTWVQKVE